MNRFWLLVLAFPSVLAAQERSFRWTDRYVLGTELRLSAGLTFADVDGDGDMDALVANGRHWPQPNEVYLNNGAARFTVSYQLGSRRHPASHAVRPARHPSLEHRLSRPTRSRHLRSPPKRPRASI